MAFFGLSTKKEVEEQKAKAAVDGVNVGVQLGKNALLHEQKTSLNNLGKGIQDTFRVPWFDVFDPRIESGVPVAVGFAIVYGIDDMNAFLQLNAMESFTAQSFKPKLINAATKFTKSVVTNAPTDANIPLVQIERKIAEVSELIQLKVTPQIERTLGINIRSLDVTSIDIDKESRGYRELKSLTSDLDNQKRMMQHQFNMSDMQLQHDTAQSNFRLQNSLQQDQLKMQSSLNLDAMKRQQEMQLGGQEEMQKMQLEMQRLQNIDQLKMQMENQRETMRIQREEMQRASKLQTEQTFLGAHQANLQSGMFNNVVNNVGAAGAMNLAGAMGGQQAVPQMPQMPGMPQKSATPQVSYMVNVNNQQCGPCDWDQLRQLVQGGYINQQTYVWTQGMPNWALAGQVPELAPLFGAPAAPQMPGMPPMPGNGPAF